jgi:hypothetical protein
MGSHASGGLNRSPCPARKAVSRRPMRRAPRGGFRLRVEGQDQSKGTRRQEAFNQTLLVTTTSADETNKKSGRSKAGSRLHWQTPDETNMLNFLSVQCAVITWRVLSWARSSPSLPAKAGIQEAEAEARTGSSWIPGLAVLARNDDSENSLRISCAQDLVGESRPHHSGGSSSMQRQRHGVLPHDVFLPDTRDIALRWASWYPVRLD